MSDKVDTESFAQLERLRELRVSHRDLDYLIDRLQDDPMVDQLRMTNCAFADSRNASFCSRT
jgi:hypothetical protein